MGPDDLTGSATELVPLDPPPADPTGSNGQAGSASPMAASTAADTQPRRPSARDVTEERMLRPRSTPPARGWRRLLYRATFGTLNVGPSARDLRQRELAARVKAPVSGSRRIVVLSRKGGVGKTTTTLMLGHTFASWRGDRVVALDGNPDAGSLGYRLRRETTQTVTGLLRDADRLPRYADVRAFTSQAPTRLEVVASDDDPSITRALGEADYHKAIRLLQHHYNLILLDTGTGILDSGIQGILKQADQIVVVLLPALDGARVAASTLDWLDSHGYGHLVQSAVAVINSVRRNGLVEVQQVEEHFAERCAATVRIPFDPHLEAGAESRLDELRSPTREAYLQLAAHVADGFSSTRSSQREEEPQ
jgi:putative peptide zinc metalloprotease protein